MTPADATVACTMALPANYRQAEVLAFHGRDAQSTAETVQGSVICKGFVWQGRAAVVRLALGAHEAHCSLSIEGAGAAVSPDLLQDLACRLLGLRMDAAAFEQSCGQHPELGPLILAQRGLRVPMAATPFEALVWAVTGQQINVGVASMLRRRLILLAGTPHASGLLCHPDASGIARLSAEQLREAKFSVAKTDTILGISRLVCEGRLPLDDWMAGVPLAVDRIREGLLSIKGVGPWTLNYVLLRGFGHADGSLHGDVAVRKALQRILPPAELKGGKVSAAQTEAWLAQFSPWRSLVAAHLWASLRFAEG